jgi:hypothetical protein
MLPTNFDFLTVERPDLGPTLHRLRDWVQTHRDWNVLDPRELARSLSDVDSFTLASALALLVESGLLRQVYVVVTPSGVLADGEYDDPRQIPKRVPDRFNHYFDTLEAEIIPVLRDAKK